MCWSFPVGVLILVMAQTLRGTESDEPRSGALHAPYAPTRETPRKPSEHPFWADAGRGTKRSQYNALHANQQGHERPGVPRPAARRATEGHRGGAAGHSEEPAEGIRGGCAVRHDRVRRAAQRLPARVSLRSPPAGSLRQPRVAEEPHGDLPHVHLRRSGPRGVVPRRRGRRAARSSTWASRACGSRSSRTCRWT